MTDPTPVSPAPTPPPPAAPAPYVAPSAAPAARPTGITILAILSAIGGVLGLLGGIGLLGLSATVLSGMGALLGLVVLALAVLNLALAWGFWTLKPWAWPLGVGLEIVSIILAIIQYVGAGTGLVSTLISIAIAGVILYYLNQPTIRSLFGRS